MSPANRLPVFSNRRMSLKEPVWREEKAPFVLAFVFIFREEIIFCPPPRRGNVEIGIFDFQVRWEGWKTV